MTRLDHVPDDDVIRRYRGTLDFAVWRGIPYARTWPRKAAHITEGTRTAALAFSELSKVQKNNAAGLRDVCTAIGQNFKWTWKDVLLSNAYGNTNIPTSQEGYPPTRVISIFNFDTVGDRIFLYIRFDPRFGDVKLNYTREGFTRTPAYRVIRGTTVQRGYTQDRPLANEIPFFYSPGDDIYTFDIPALIGAQPRAFAFRYDTHSGFPDNNRIWWPPITPDEIVQYMTRGFPFNLV